MRASRLDPGSQFEEIFKEVRGRGECIVDTGAVFYILREEAVEKLKRLASLLEGLNHSAPQLVDGEKCGACAKERAELLGRSTELAGKGRLDDAKLLLMRISVGDDDDCAACAADLSRRTSPLLEYAFTLKETDFVRRPFLSSAVKEPVDGELVDEYRTPLGSVRVAERGGVLYYDPELPVDGLTIRELSLLVELKAWMEREMSENPSKALEHPSRGHYTDRQKLLRILDIYMNKLGDLQYIIADKRLTDVYVNSSGKVRVSNYLGDDMECTLRYTGEELERLASRLRVLSGKPFDHSHPLLSYFWEEENCRFSAGGYTGSYSMKPDLAVRLWPEKPWHILDILHMRSVNLRLASLLTVAANLGAAIIIGGDRGGGKSTLLQSFLFMIPREVRKVALLTERELHSWFFEQDFNISEFRVHTGEKVASRGIPIAQAVKQLLIHGESGYLMLNEVKYEEEARPFFTMAAAAGISSLLTTMHAEDARGVVQRLMIDFGLPPSALRNIDWVVSMGLVRRGINEGRRRVLSEITEVKSFKGDPLAEERLHGLASYDPLREEWEMAPLEELLVSSDFLNRNARRRGMGIGDVADLVRALERVYRRMYRSYPVQPEKLTVLMQRFFDSYEPGKSAEEVYGDWWRRCSRIF
jgi:type IV secretory pathway ATPase VirB11/archaellum biosynthesis ATPase